MDNNYVENTRKVAVLRANGIGDLIVTLPAIDALKETYPEAEIVLFGKEWQAAFLTPYRTHIDRVIVLPKSFFLSKEVYIDSYDQEMEVFFTKMKQEKFDIAIHFHGEDIFSNIFLSHLGAKVTVGHQHKKARALDRMASYFYYQPEVFRYLELVKTVAANTVNIEPKISINQDEIDTAKQILKKYNIHTPFIILHPGSSDYRRQWPVSKFAEVAKYYIRKGMDIVITGTSEEETLLESLNEQIDDPLACILRELDLSVLAALMTLSILFISNDTGPLHLARAVNCRTVGVFWGPNILNWGPLFREQHGLAISWRLVCPMCGTIPATPYPFEPKSPECSHFFSFVENITVEEVIGEAERVLK
ncbi:MAG TPA: glycosyltransferase family 9 protein [Sphingobacterium sp.]|nr:glycosyltransferase family 9 protein [Sphingobacterium sp.]